MYNPSIQNVTIIPGSVDAIQAFDDMCFSDVLITGASGYSYLVSILCKTPIILGVPFWRSYNPIPNAIKLDVERGLPLDVPSVGVRGARLIRSASFNESMFQFLWQEKISRGGGHMVQK